MFPADHNPPHVHFIGSGWEVQIQIDTLKIIKGKFSKRSEEKLVLSWIAENQNFLMKKWQDLSR